MRFPRMNTKRVCANHGVLQRSLGKNGTGRAPWVERLGRSGFAELLRSYRGEATLLAVPTDGADSVRRLDRLSAEVASILRAGPWCRIGRRIIREKIRGGSLARAGGGLLALGPFLFLQEIFQLLVEILISLATIRLIHPLGGFAETVIHGVLRFGSILEEAFRQVRQRVG